MISGCVAAFSVSTKLARAVGQRLQRLRSGAELLVVVAQVAGLADHADRQLALRASACGCGR